MGASPKNHPFDFAKAVTSGWHNIVTLHFLTPLLNLGAKRPLILEDLGSVPSSDRAKVQLQNFEESKDSVKTFLLKHHKWELALGMFLNLVYASLGFVPPLLLRAIVSHLDGTDRLETTALWVHVALFLVAPTLASIAGENSRVIMSRLGTRVKTAIMTRVFNKAMRLNARAMSKTSTGTIVNLMSNDAQQIQRFANFCNLLWTSPIQIGVALWLIYREVGNAMWVGFGFMVILFPFTGVVFAIVSKCRRKILKFSDERVKLMSQILNGIRILKFYAWENAFSKLVLKVRTKELAALKKLAYTIAIGFSLVLLSAPVLQPILVFSLYEFVVGGVLTIPKMFTTLALFNLIRFPFAFLPLVLTQWIQTKVALARLSKYLALDELNNLEIKNSEDDSVVFECRGATFAWQTIVKQQDDDGDAHDHLARKRRKRKRKKNTEPEKDDVTKTKVEMESIQAGPTLVNVDIKVVKNTLTAVVGPVGSGKSSLLSAILGEIPCTSGKVVRGQGCTSGVAYAAQQPWILNTTLKENVIFGKELDESKYNRCLADAALLPDLEILKDGDMTEIGERGITLSGGQKARVSLARALYSSHNLIVLDDVFSAVDSHVAKQLLDTVTSLKGTRTVVLATNSMQALPKCDNIIVLESGGCISGQGAYDDLMANPDVDLFGAQVIKKEASKNKGVEEGQQDDEDSPKEGIESGDAKKSSKLMTEEERETGDVNKEAYAYYAKAAGIPVVVFVLLTALAARAGDIIAPFWLAEWGETVQERIFQGTSFTRSDTRYYSGIYAAIGIAGVAMLTVRSLLIAKGRVRAATDIHEKLLVSVLNAPVSWYESTPIGRILSRFSQDMDRIDLELGSTLAQLLSCLFNVAGALVAIALATKAIFLAIAPLLIWVFYKMQKHYRKTSTEVQRIDSISRSPIYANFAQCLDGLPSIRAYAREKDFMSDMQSSVDGNTTPFLIGQFLAAWLGLRLDIIGGFITFGIACFGAASDQMGASFSVEWVAVGLTFSLEMVGFLKHMTRMIAQAESQMNSVERVKFFTEHTASEASRSTGRYGKAVEIPDSWPSTGRIVAENLSMKYASGSTEVLKNLCFSIEAGEHVGICGRTGSGKSSLLLALLRIVEPTGSVKIDGLDIQADVGLSVLRSRLGIIPQDPVLFAESVRFNIDPFEEFGDDDIWNALEKVQLKGVVSSLPDKLQHCVSEGGKNFSVGERQLFCIARALLRGPKVLLW